MNRSALRVLVSSGLFVCTAAAQCATPWLPGGGVVGTDAGVRASTMWDPDGAGPAPAKLVIGGDFSLAVNAVANRVATWEPVSDTWSALDAGVGTASGSHIVRA